MIMQVCQSGTEDVQVPVVTRKGKHRGDVFLKLAFKASSKQMVGGEPRCRRFSDMFGGNRAQGFMLLPSTEVDMAERELSG